MCQMYISLDNYDELISNSPSDSKMTVPAEVDKILSKWAESNNAAIESISEDTYLATLYRRDVDNLIEGRFFDFWIQLEVSRPKTIFQLV